MDMALEVSLFLAGLAVGLFILWYQERYPVLTVTCDVDEEASPQAIYCRVKNDGRGQARDVFVGFNRSYPAGTLLVAKPEFGLEVVPSNSPPDPNMLPLASEHIQAFAVKIPRIPPKTEIEFQVRTSDPDNNRASEQIVRLREEIRAVLSEFGAQVVEEHPEYASGWDLDAAMSARGKEENIFRPGIYVFEEGSESVEFLNQEDTLALAVLDDLYRKFKPEFKEVFETGKSFKAPVLKINTAEGERTFARMPPFVKTGVEFQVSLSEMRKRKPIILQPPIPDSYD